jgi:hypothetical protein
MTGDICLDNHLRFGKNTGAFCVVLNAATQMRVTVGNTRLLTKQARGAALHEKLLIKNLPKFCNTGMFIAVFTTAHH